MIGDFRSNGSWDAEAPTPERTMPGESLYWFVDMLVTSRRRIPSKPPWEYAIRIAKTRWKSAFPSAMNADPADRKRWSATVLVRDDQVAIPFFCVGAQTSAEAAVIFGGYPHQQDDPLRPIQTLFDNEVRGRPELIGGRSVEEMMAEILAAFAAFDSIGGPAPLEQPEIDVAPPLSG